jgi:hypothetical protein
MLNLMDRPQNSAAWIAATVILLTGCGIFDQSGSGTVTFNDPMPSGGTQVASGQFLNSSAVSGTVRVIRTASTSFVIRLENFSTTSSLPLSLTATVDGTVGAVSQQLRATSGNMNYTVSANYNAVFSTVEIRPPGSVATSSPIATCTLTH